MTKHFFLTLLFSLLWLSTQAQKVGNKVQLTGLVVSGEEQYGVPGVHVFIPKAGKGVITDQLGYFSISTFPGDSLVISAIGYDRKSYLVKRNEERESISLIVNLHEDTTVLPEVTIYPYPTEELLKEAFLALELPETEHENMRRNMEKNMLRYMAYNYEGDGSLNHDYFLDRQYQSWKQDVSVPVIQLLNPFAWGKFIKSVKDGDLKRKKWMDMDKE